MYGRGIETATYCYIFVRIWSLKHTNQEWLEAFPFCFQDTCPGWVWGIVGFVMLCLRICGLIVTRPAQREWYKIGQDTQKFSRTWQARRINSYWIWVFWVSGYRGCKITAIDLSLYPTLWSDFVYGDDSESSVKHTISQLQPLTACRWWFFARRNQGHYWAVLTSPLWEPPGGEQSDLREKVVQDLLRQRNRYRWLFLNHSWFQFHRFLWDFFEIKAHRVNCMACLLATECVGFLPDLRPTLLRIQVIWYTAVDHIIFSACPNRSVAVAHCSGLPDLLRRGGVWKFWPKMEHWWTLNFIMILLKTGWDGIFVDHLLLKAWRKKHHKEQDFLPRETAKFSLRSSWPIWSSCNCPVWSSRWALGSCCCGALPRPLRSTSFFCSSAWEDWEGHVLGVKWRCQCEHVIQIYRICIHIIHTYMYLPLSIVIRPPCVNFCVDSLIEFAYSYKSSTVYSVQQMNPS